MRFSGRLRLNEKHSATIIPERNTLSIDPPNAGPSSSRPRSVIGNLADLKEGEVALPRFFSKRADGLFVDLPKLDSSESFLAVVDRVFSANAYFMGLDYPLFSKLLYGFDPRNFLGLLKNPAEPSTMVRFALDIVAFRPERSALYKSVKIGNGMAEYFFEPVYQEHEIEEPVYEDGVLLRYQKKTILEPTTLTFDEFVADMWNKGIRFGIDTNVVQTAIQGGKSGRLIVTRRREAIPGKAADIKELAKEIHRDDAPIRLPDGRVDLSQFKNRFPQINKGVRLIKKIPLVLGTTGYEISGNPIEPPIPKDLNLASLSGPGTAVEIDKEGEFIVSQQDGFLNFDAQTNQISIVEKIVSRDGVSARTTGNLTLTGDEFEEHGEVQEKRIVEGNSITIHADVYGTISSRGGRILLKSNLVGGMAINQNGDICVEGLASNATLQTKKGEVRLKRAENCTIIGTRVFIEKASNCTILADEVNITEAHGCALAAKAIRIESAGARKESEMLVFALVPDLGKFDQLIAGLTTKTGEVELALNKKSQDAAKITSQPEIRNYLVIGAKLKKNELVLTPEQQSNFQKLTASVNPLLRTLGKLNAEIATLQEARSSFSAQMAVLAESKKEAEAGIHCVIARVMGETVVRTMIFGPDGDLLHNLPAKDLKTKLRGATATGERIFTGRSGSLDWIFTAPH